MGKGQQAPTKSTHHKEGESLLLPYH